MKKIVGLISAPFTPMNEDGSLNLNVIPQYYHFLKKRSKRPKRGQKPQKVMMTSR